MVNYEVIWSDRALLSLKNIHDFIVPNNQNQAKKVISKIFKQAATLSVLPFRNPIEPLLKNEPIEYRFIVEGNYKIIYFVENNDIVITLVFDSRKNPTKLPKGE